MPTEINNDAAANEVPEWLTETPRDHGYQLVMFENDESSIQTVDMDREEYIAMKEHLAAMRGIQRQPQTDARAGKLAVLQTAEVVAEARDNSSDVPGWIYETPEPMRYSMAMEEPGGDHLQDVDITREEYAALKIRVAEMRGLVPAAKGE
jgi:hypothetical protein